VTAPQQAAPPPSPQEQASQDTALAVAIAGALVTAVSVSQALGMIRLQVTLNAARYQALEQALGVVMNHPPGQDGFYGPAGRETARVNLLRRAQFAVSAMHRLAGDIADARARNQPVVASASGITRERRYYAQHLTAIWNRTRAGARTDDAIMRHGTLLGWHAVRDAKTSRECLAADRHNFYADRMPLIGYPGAVHTHCRCMPGPPWTGAPLLPGYRTTLRRAA